MGQQVPAIRILRIALAAVVVLVAAPIARGQNLPPLHARGLEYGFNLDYTEALATFQQAIAQDPNDSTAHRLAAATIWMQILFQQGAITVEDYLGQARAKVTRTAPPPALAAAFRTHVDRAIAIAEQRVRAGKDDADAHFQLGAANGLRASYIATVEGRIFDSVGTARRAYAEQKRSLTLDPRRKDAGLIVGLYQYGVASLSLPLRWMARLAGFQSGRESGLRLVEDAAALASDVQASARFSLALIYNREERHDDALRVIRELQQQYPRNRLLWLEAASTALRGKRPAEALQLLDQGLARSANDQRPRGFGEQARWHYYRGAALVAMRDGSAARRELQTAVELEGPLWVRGRARLELGQALELLGQRPAALESYRRAFDDCRAADDSACADDAKRLVRGTGR